MGTELATWLNAEVKQRGWSLRQTARRAGLSHSTVARLANGEVGWTPETCVALASAFSVSVEEIFRLAGILPVQPAPAVRQRRIVYEVNGEELLLELWRSLSVEDQTLVRDLIYRLASVEPKVVE